MECPTCHSKNIYDHPISGTCCGRCGLIIETYNNKITTNKVPKKIGKCLGCKQKKPMTIHHIIPKRDGGKEKIVKLCRACHNIADIIANVIYPLDVTLNNEKEGK